MRDSKQINFGSADFNMIRFDAIEYATLKNWLADPSDVTDRLNVSIDFDAEDVRISCRKTSTHLIFTRDEFTAFRLGALAGEFSIEVG